MKLWWLLVFLILEIILVVWVETNPGPKANVVVGFLFGVGFSFTWMVFQWGLDVYRDGKPINREKQKALRKRT